MGEDRDMTPGTLMRMAMTGLAILSRGLVNAAAYQKYHLASTPMAFRASSRGRRSTCLAA